MCKINKAYLLLILILLSCRKDNYDLNLLEIPVDINLPTHPFPSHINYIGEHIKPNNYSEFEIDNHTITFYNKWKNKYLKQDCENQQEYYLQYENKLFNNSEAHGFGMIIIAFMAGYEKSSKYYFDGLFKFFKSNTSTTNSLLMIDNPLICSDYVETETNSSSLGDINIAFSLLLAHEQWGSSGEINYENEAYKIINAILLDDINETSLTVKFGNWVKPENTDLFYCTRTSDFWTNHFKCFASFTENNDWIIVSDNCYNLIETNQNPDNGLIPDYIININQINPSPAPPNYIQSNYDGDNYYNASLLPWITGNDFLLTGDNRAKTSSLKLTFWLHDLVGTQTSLISNGYKLDGTPISNKNTSSFIAPITVGAMIDINHQTLLNSFYSYLINENKFENQDFHANTVKMLCLITISGNYWKPS